MSLIRNAFQRLHYLVDIIAQCARWYLAYDLSLRNLEEMMAERGIFVDHSTLHRWVIRLVPSLDKAFRRRKRSVGRRWRMDETYIKVKGQWKISLPRGGYFGADHRLHADRQTGRCGCITLLSQSH